MLKNKFGELFAMPVEMWIALVSLGTLPPSAAPPPNGRDVSSVFILAAAPPSVCPPPAPCDCGGTQLNFTGTATSLNNLGGMGPNFDEPEGTIVYTRIDGNTPDTGDYDLEVKNVTYYMYAAARPDAIALATADRACGPRQAQHE